MLFTICNISKKSQDERSAMVKVELCTAIKNHQNVFSLENILLRLIAPFCSDVRNALGINFSKTSPNSFGDYRGQAV